MYHISLIHSSANGHLSLIHGIWTFLSQELNPSHSDSLTHCTGWGSNKSLCSDLSHGSQILNPLRHHRNSRSGSFFIFFGGGHWDGAASVVCGEFLGLESNLHHSSALSCCSDNPRSLTYCTTGEIFLFSFPFLF